MRAATFGGWTTVGNWNITSRTKAEPSTIEGLLSEYSTYVRLWLALKLMVMLLPSKAASLKGIRRCSTVAPKYLLVTDAQLSPYFCFNPASAEALWKRSDSSRSKAESASFHAWSASSIIAVP